MCAIHPSQKYDIGICIAADELVPAIDRLLDEPRVQIRSDQSGNLRRTQPRRFPNLGANPAALLLAQSREWERTEEFNRGSSSNEGVFTFTGYASNNAWADYLLGKPSAITQNSPYERLVKGWDWYAYVQDDIRLTSRLTVNLGLRYQLFVPYHAVYDRTNTYRAGQQSTVVPNAPVGMVFPGDAGISPGLVPVDSNNFAPRVGLAWDPFGKGKLMTR